MSGLRPNSRRTALGAAAVAALLVLPGCSSDHDEPTPAPEAARTTALADLSPAGLTVARAPFCDAVADADVEAALDGPPESARAWQSGDKVAVADGSDVAHEVGCAWRGASPAEAAAWVFVPPVSTARAREVVRAQERRDGCRPLPDAGPFGEPAAATLCREDGALVASYRGLFGDSWLTCEVRAAETTDAAGEADLAARADRWCAVVLGAAAVDAPS